MDRIVSFDPINEAAETEERESLWDHCIVDFVNFKDKTGTVIECTKPNKIKLMKNPMFMRFFNKCLKDLSSSSGAVLKAETENL